VFLDSLWKIFLREACAGAPETSQRGTKSRTQTCLAAFQTKAVTPLYNMKNRILNSGSKVLFKKKQR